MSGFAEELVEIKARKGSQCSVKLFLDTLPDETVVEIEEALAEKTSGAWSYPSSSVANLLRSKYDFVTTASTVGRHRNRSCLCP